MNREPEQEEDRFWEALQRDRRVAELAEDAERGAAREYLARLEAQAQPLAEAEVERMTRRVVDQRDRLRRDLVPPGRAPSADAAAASAGPVSTTPVRPRRGWFGATWRVCAAAGVVVLAHQFVVAAREERPEATSGVRLINTPETLEYQSAIHILVDPLHNVGSRRASLGKIFRRIASADTVLTEFAAAGGDVGVAAQGLRQRLRGAIDEGRPYVARRLRGDPIEMLKAVRPPETPAVDRLAAMERAEPLLVQGIEALLATNAAPHDPGLDPELPTLCGQLRESFR